MVRPIRPSQSSFIIEQYYRIRCFHRNKRSRNDDDSLHHADVLELNVPPNLDEWETVRHRLLQQSQSQQQSQPNNKNVDPLTLQQQQYQKLQATILLHLGYLMHSKTSMPLIQSICSCWELMPTIIMELKHHQDQDHPQHHYQHDHCNHKMIDDATLVLHQVMQLAKELNNDTTLTICARIAQNWYHPDNKHDPAILDILKQQQPSTSNKDIPTMTQLVETLASNNSTIPERQTVLRQLQHMETTILLMENPNVLWNQIAQCCQIPDFEELCLVIWTNIVIQNDNDYYGTLLVRIPKVLDAIVLAMKKSTTPAMDLLVRLSNTVVNRTIMASHHGLISTLVRSVRIMPHNNEKRMVVKKCILQLAELL